MSSGSIPDFSSDYIPDVTFTGAMDTSYGDYSGSSTLQDTIVGPSGLALDNSFGQTTGSVTDFIDYNDPVLSQTLAGTTDPPIGSSYASLPNGYAPPQTSSLSDGLHALSKFGSSFAALLGGSSGVTRQVQPASYAVPRPAAGAPVSGQTTIILVIVVVAVCLLVAKGGD